MFTALALSAAVLSSPTPNWATDLAACATDVGITTNGPGVGFVSADVPAAQFWNYAQCLSETGLLDGFVYSLMGETSDADGTQSIQWENGNTIIWKYDSDDESILIVVTDYPVEVNG